MVKAIFLFLKGWEFLTFYKCGARMDASKNTIVYWRLSIIPIIVYSLVEGLRFGRRIDWNLYCERYLDIANSSQYLSEPLFYYTSLFFRNIGIPYPFYIVLLSFLFISSAILLLSNFKGELKWSMPLLLYFTLLSENYIRWYFAFSFLLIGIHCYLNHGNKKALLFSILAILTHNGISVIVLFLLLKPFLSHTKIHYVISLPLVIFFTLWGGIALLSNLQEFTYMISFISNQEIGISRYYDEMQNIVNGDYGSVGVITKSFFAKIRNLVMYAAFVYFGHKKCNGSNEIFVYNLFCIGAILFPLFSQVEILDRYSDFLCFFACIVGAKSLILLEDDFWGIYLLVLSCVFLNIFWWLYRGDPNMMLFIWDAHGRDYLPYWNLHLW